MEYRYRQGGYPPPHYMGDQWQNFYNTPNGRNGNNYHAVFKLDRESGLRIRVSDFQGKVVLHMSRESRGPKRKAQYLHMKGNEFIDLLNSKDLLLAKIKDCSDFINKMNLNQNSKDGQTEEEEEQCEIIPKTASDDSQNVKVKRKRRNENQSKKHKKRQTSPKPPGNDVKKQTAQKAEVMATGDEVEDADDENEGEEVSPPPSSPVSPDTETTVAAAVNFPPTRAPRQKRKNKVPLILDSDADDEDEEL